MKLFVSSRLIASIGLVKGVDLVKRCGYDGIELWYEQLSNYCPKEIRRLLKRDLATSIHAASCDINLTSTNVRIAAASIEEVERSIEWGAELGASCVVVHPGRASLSKDDPGIYGARQRDAFEKLLMFGRSCGVRIAVENMERRAKELIISPDSVGTLVSELADLRLFVCLDSAHAFNAGGIDAFLSSPWIDRAIHFHISHTTASETHVPLDHGTSTMTLQLRDFLATFTGAVVVEGAERRSRDAAELLAANRAVFLAFQEGDVHDRVR